MRLSTALFPPRCPGRRAKHMGSGERWESRAGPSLTIWGTRFIQLWHHVYSVILHLLFTYCHRKGTHSFLMQPILWLLLIYEYQRTYLIFLSPLILGMIVGSCNRFMISLAMIKSYSKLQHCLLPPCSSTHGAGQEIT